jgi:hypothetical protein
MVSPHPGAIVLSPHVDNDAWDLSSVTRYN